MARHYIIALYLLFFVALFRPFTVAGEYKAFNYHRTNGLPGNKVYHLYQDSRDYIWIGTENGLVSFNGHEFKTYTVKDGLPDNEIMGIKEDRRSGKLWLTPFSNEVCYIWKGKIYNADNDPLLRKLKLASLPKNIEFDCWGNTWISETGALTLINSKGKISKIYNVGNDRFRPVTPLGLDDSGRAIIVNETKYYRHNGSHFELVTELPIHPSYHYSHSKFLEVILKEFSWTPLPLFIKRYKSGQDIYCQGKELTSINFLNKLSEDLLYIGSEDGACLKDIKTGKTITRFCEGYNATACLLSTDGSLWIGTLGNGIFHYFPSFIKSVPISAKSRRITFIKAQENNLHFILGENTFAEVKLNRGTQPEVSREKIINNKDLYSYIEQDELVSWLVCESDFISKYTQLGAKPISQHNIGYCKSVFDEGNALLVGTLSGIVRINKAMFRITDTFYDKRVTSIAKVNRNIYAGTLDGLLMFDPNKRITTPFADEPMLKGHIIALCTDGDSTLWVANNKAALIGIYNNRILTVIAGNTGLECCSVVTIKVSDKYLWVGTDKGLYVINKRPPFNIIRHLSSANGLDHDKINCLDIAAGRVWVGTENGLNYFDEDGIKPTLTTSKFFINGIQNDENNIIPAKAIMELNGKTLRMDFDVVDHAGGIKPIYAYSLNDNNWIDIERNSLYFPTIPYGNFTIAIKAVSSNWNAPKILKLSFYRAYPFYMSWWFILLTVLLSLVLIGSLIILFLKRVRKKDREQLLIQQNLLQLEQMALQGQMNPHFIFNCITAIRQYYNKGDLLKANRFVDIFSALIRTTFEMVNQTFTSLENELNYLNQYLIVEQERFNQTFDFSITKDIQSAAPSIPVPAMLLQPLVENAVRHGVRNLSDGTGKINISVVQEHDLIHITIEDNGIGRAKTQKMKQNIFQAVPVTSTTVNKRRIDILNKLFNNKISMSTEDIEHEEGQVAGTKVLISYPLDIYVFE